jgi:NitT/TauT family transport system ATP-binding protein
MIEFQRVAMGFASRGSTILALREASLEIARHEFVALVGPSGCGKSTLLNMVAGLLRPSRGVVLYDGAPVEELNTRVGYMTQHDDLLPWRTVAGNIDFPLEIRGEDRASRTRQVAEHVAFMGLEGFEDHYPGELSGGMRKRVSLAQTLIADPETLLMDEPFAALDAQLRLVMQDELLRIWRERRKTILFVTHDLVEAITLADRVILMSRRPGTILTVQEVSLPRPRDVYRIRFDPEFVAMHEKLWEGLRDQIGRGEE